MHFLRKLTPLVLCILFFLGVFHVARADITSNLVGWWKFDDGTGTTAVDSSGNSNTGTLVNSPSWTSSAKIGAYAELQTVGTGGTGSYVTTANTVNGTHQDESFAAWIYPTDLTGQSNHNIFLHTDDFWLEVFTNGELNFHGRDNNDYTYTGGTIPLNTWTHIALTCSDTVGGTGTVTMYINGSQVYQTTSAVICYNNLPSNLTIGGYGNASYGWTGRIDDVRYYLRVLSSTDIADLYAYTGSTGIPSPSAGSWYSTSNSFFVHAKPLSIGGGNPVNSFSTSSSFKVAGAANEAAVGTSSSSSFQVQSGFMRNIFKGPAPNYTLAHYHWRNDDGSETTATSKTGGAQDTAITSVSKLSTNRLRIEVSNEGGTIANYSTQQFQLEYGLKVSTCAAISSWTSVGTGGDWDVSNSSNLTEGANTTNISTSVGGVTDENHTFISSNAGVKDTSSLVSALSVPSDSFAELEYSIQPTSSATDGGVYCFRVTNAGSNTNFTYSQYPQATIASGGTTLTFVVDSGSEAFPSVTPGTLSATTTILSVTTNNSTGFSASIQRGDSTGTMSLGTTYIPDKTDWIAPSATTSAGNATASTTQPQTLQFRIRKFGTDTPNFASSWWGTDDTTANALFGGIPSTTQKIINRSTVANSTTTAFVQYDLNVPVSQKNGTYSGSITYTVTANP